MSKYWQTEPLNDEIFEKGGNIIIKTTAIARPSIDDASWTVLKNQVYAKSHSLANIVSSQSLLQTGVVEVMIKPTSSMMFFVKDTINWLQNDLDRYVIEGPH